MSSLCDVKRRAWAKVQVSTSLITVSLGWCSGTLLNKTAYGSDEIARPRVLVEYAFIQPELREKVGRWIAAFAEKLNAARNNSQLAPVQFDEDLESRSPNLIRRLHAEDVVGLVWVGHTRAYRDLGTAAYVDRDGLEYPSELFTAVSPNFKFVSFLGCDGPGLVYHYQLTRELAATGQKARIFSSRGKVLSTRGIAKILSLVTPFDVDTVKDVLNEMTLALTHERFNRAWEMQRPQSLAKMRSIRFRVKDVLSRLQYRYLYLNDRLVDTLGAELESSNDQWAGSESERPSQPLSKDWKEIEYDLRDQPRWASSSNRVQLRPIHLSPEDEVFDDYLVSDMTITLEDGRSSSRHYDPPRHIGAYSGPSVELLDRDASGAAPRRIDRETDESYQRRLGRSVRSLTWLDRAPASWPTDYELIFKDELVFQ